MLNNLFSLTTAFRFINFGVFLGLVVYCYKKYLLPSINKQIHEKKLLLQNLENQKQGIKYQLSNLDQAIDHQKHLAQNLSNKINIWSEGVNAQRQRDYETKNALLKTMINQAAIKSQKVAFEAATKKIVPEVLKNLEEDLTQYFEQNEHAREYNGDILRFIEESKQ